MTNTHCIVCSNLEFTLLFEKKQKISDLFSNKLKIEKCTKCGLIRKFMNLKERKKLNFFYKNVYSNNLSFKEPSFKELITDNAVCREILAYLPRKIIKEKRLKLLDIGCGSGKFLNVARKKGFEVYGNEISIMASKYAEKKYNLNISSDGFIKAKYKDNFFDVVNMNHLIEHLVNPSAYLIEIYRILKPGGLLRIATPDVNNLAVRTLWKNHRMFTFEHLHYFSKDTVSRMVEKLNYKILICKTTRNFSLRERLSLLGLSVESFFVLLFNSLGDTVLYARK